MFEYRVTKYNPAFRNELGGYIPEDWTSMSEIGREFEGVVLSEDEYRRVEQAYIDSAFAFLSESGLTSLRVRGLENHQKLVLEFGEGSVLSLDEISGVMRRILREELWCRLEAPSGFVHFGWDYYMYIGVPQRCPAAEKRAGELGLYPEDFASPYRESS